MPTDRTLPPTAAAHGAPRAATDHPPPDRSGLWDVVLPLRPLVRHRALVGQFAQRMVKRRYRGTSLGIGWSILAPLLLLGAYTFVFGVVFKSRWGLSELPGPAEFALALFAGLTVFWFFSEVVNGAPQLVIDHTNLVKKSIFPVEILPYALVGSALFHAGINLGLLLAALVVLGQPPGAMALLLPVLLLPLMLFALGLGWILAAVGVFLRDVGQIVSLLVTLALFLAPIFYPLTAVPEQFADLIRLNPLTPIVEATRGVLLFDRWPDLQALGVQAAVGWLVAGLGLALFRRARRGFGDVL